jgi:hypothetical protein
MTHAEEERKRRLARALRENLKRRKAQDRARQAGEPPAGDRPAEAGFPGKGPASEQRDESATVWSKEPPGAGCAPPAPHSAAQVRAGVTVAGCRRRPVVDLE